MKSTAKQLIKLLPKITKLLVPIAKEDRKL